MWLHFKLQFSLYIKFGPINHYPWEFNILQLKNTNDLGVTKHCTKLSHSRKKKNLWVKKPYVSIEQAVFWLEVVCCLGKELGEEVDRSPSPTPTKTSFVSTNDHWSVNKKSKIELKIYDVEFEISHGDRRNAASENQLASHSNVEYWFRHQN